MGGDFLLFSFTGPGWFCIPFCRKLFRMVFFIELCFFSIQLMGKLGLQFLLTGAILFFKRVFCKSASENAGFKSLFERTKFVFKLASGGIVPQTPSFFCVPKRNQKGIPQTPEGLLAPVRLFWNPKEAIPRRNSSKSRKENESWSFS
jgi:hypothetical protein